MRTKLWYEGWYAGVTKTEPRPDNKREHQEQSGRDLSAKCECCQRCSGDARPIWTAMSKCLPVEGVGEDTTDDGKEHVGQHVDGLDQRAKMAAFARVHEQTTGRQRSASRATLLTSEASHNHLIPTRSGSPGRRGGDWLCHRMAKTERGSFSTL